MKTTRPTSQNTNQNMNAARVQPHSLEAEEYLLSCVLLDADYELPRALGAGIMPESFYAPANQVIFAVMLDLHAAGKPVDSGSLAEALKAGHTLDEIGGYAYLTQVSKRIPTAAQASYFAGRVRDLARLREIIRIGSNIVERAFTVSLAPGDVIEETFGADVAALSGALLDQKKARAWADVVGEAEAITQARIENKADGGSLFEVGWGFADFDKYFQKMEAGELVVLSARPSVGKSSLMRQVAVAAARRGEPVLVSSLEVTDVEAAINLAANISGVRSRKALDQLPGKDKADLLGAFGVMRDLDKFGVCDKDTSLAELIARAKAFKARHGLRLWAIDYLQLIRDTKMPQRGERVDQAIGRVTSELKAFAVGENVVVMLLSQLNRGVENDGNRVPMLADLRDSGRIEEDANRVVFLHRPDEFILDGMKQSQSHTANVGDQPQFYVNAIQSKGRNHGTASLGMMFQRQTATFRQIAR
jgi:replicative DNA helicase